MINRLEERNNWTERKELYHTGEQHIDVSSCVKGNNSKSKGKGKEVEHEL